MTTDGSTLLGGLSPAAFLERYWQRRPLLVRSALPGFRMPVDAAALKRLACRSDIRSRLVTDADRVERGAARSGPFEAADLEALPPRGWSLLIHETDRHVPGLAELLERFRFVPNWRIDDVMVSLAPDGGGVGPHVDRYDVFLFQGQGRRRWRIREAELTGMERLVQHDGLRLLTDIEFDREFVLGPGDMLYLPPRIPHEGVALDGESMTCSIGFRAPDPRELCASFLTQLPPSAFEAIRYADPDLTQADQPGEISAVARDRLRSLTAGLFVRGGEFDRWVGCFVTRPLRDPPQLSSPPVRSPDELRRRLAEGSVLTRSAPPHFAWFADEQGVHLFVGGEGYRLERDAEDQAELLCGRQALDLESLGPSLAQGLFAGIVLDLLIRGYLRLVGPRSTG